MKSGKKEPETKTEWTSNAEQYEKFIKQFGKKEFQRVSSIDDRYKKMEPIPFPEGFTWIVQHFLKIWRHCETDINGNRIFTPRQILDYCNCFGVNLNYHERQFIIKMKEWTVEAIAELKSEKENE